jgi:hypothetical protein
MHLKLRATKHKFHSKWEIHFAVVDLDKSGHYPENFVCGLPSLKESLLKKTAAYPFLQFFGKTSSEVAKALLTDALTEQDDLD